MSTRLILIGEGAPAERLLIKSREISKLEWLRWYTDTPLSLEIERVMPELTVCQRPARKINEPDEQNKLRSLKPDWILSLNSTLVVNEMALSTAQCGALNGHPGPLPQYAGLHAPQWAIRNGETKFSVTVHWMEGPVDVGPIAFSRAVSLGENDTGLSLTVRALNATADLLVFSLKEISLGRLLPKKSQDLSFRRVFRHQDSLDPTIDWTQTAMRIFNFVRAADYAPFKSPTYIPELRLNGRTFLIQKAEILGEGPGGLCSGHIIEQTGNSAIVVCGDGKLIRVSFLVAD